MGLPQKSKSFAAFIFVMLVMLFAGLYGWSYMETPESITLIEGHAYQSQTVLPCSVSSIHNGYAMVKAFGMIPVKNMRVNVIPETTVFVSGAPIGIRMQSKGVLITGFVGFLTQGSTYVNPAKDSGMEVGDRILAVNGKTVNSADELLSVVTSCQGKQISLSVERNGKTRAVQVRPCCEEESNIYKIGVWVKDSAAGIGTLTFYEKDTGFFGALGHGISDASGLFPISGGALHEVEIFDVVKGIPGSPGELRGYFKNAAVGIGAVRANNEAGVYGVISEDCREQVYGVEMQVGVSSMVREGKAIVRTTIGEGEPKDYEIEIVRANKNKVTSPKGLVIKIKDPDLLESTGGIVQGMSGSPILQDGRLIGAVTHVMINDPTVGYGMFIEGMLANKNCIHTAEKSDIQSIYEMVTEPAA